MSIAIKIEPKTKVKMQAREIKRFADRNKLTLERMKVDLCHSGLLCARAALCRMVFGNSNAMYDQELADALNVHISVVNSIENGFEGRKVTYRNTPNTAVTRRYYRVGQNVAKLAGYKTKVDRIYE